MAATYHVISAGIEEGVPWAVAATTMAASSY